MCYAILNKSILLCTFAKNVHHSIEGIELNSNSTMHGGVKIANSIDTSVINIKCPYNVM